MMGPERGSPRYEEQAEQVRAFLRNIDARTPDDEDQIIALFATDPDYSRDAIMDGLGRWRTEIRAEDAAARQTAVSGAVSGAEKYPAPGEWRKP